MIETVQTDKKGDTLDVSFCLQFCHFMKKGTANAAPLSVQISGKHIDQIAQSICMVDSLQHIVD